MFNSNKVKEQGYFPSKQNENKWINGKGGTVVFSETDKSVKINQGHYNSHSDTKKSTKW